MTATTSLELRRLAAQWLRAGILDATWIASGERVAANRLVYELLPDGADQGAGTAESLAVVAGIERGTLLQCAVRVALPKLVADGTVPATRLGIEAAVIRALRSCENSLTSLGDLATARGLPGRLAATMAEIREQKVDPAAVHDLPTTGADLARILDHYSRALTEAGVVDRTGVFAAAVEAIEDIAALPLRRFLGFEQPLRSTVEEEFVAALTRGGVECAAFIIDADRGSVDRYQRAWAVEAQRENETPTDDTSGLTRLRRDLFSDRSERPPPTEEDSSVQILAAPGEEREAVEIARRIHRLVAEGCRFDDVGIVVRSPDIYQPVFEEAFSRSQIPAYFSRGTLRPDPAGRAFLALLACRAEEYSATRFAEYLSLGQVPQTTHDTRTDAAVWQASADPSVVATNVDGQPDEPGAQLTIAFSTPAAEPEPAINETPQPAPSFPRRWEHLLVEASVIGGHQRWRSRLEGLEQELKARLDYVSSEDSSRARGIRATLDQVRNLQRFALPLIEQLAELPDEADVGDWIPALEALARSALRRPRRVLTLLADLRPMAGVGSMRFGELRLLLEQRLGELRLDPEGSPYGKVFVGTPEEVRGLSFDTVLVCGLAEGIFPRRVREDPLLLDDARRRLDASLATNDQRVAEERLRLQTAIAAAESRLIISYPTWDGLTGRARVPSFYAFDTAAAAWRRIERLTEVSSRSPVADDPGLAIDAAEYDVATLQSLLATRNAERGRCAYLMDTSPHLARSLKVRGRRWLNFLSAADGLVDPGPDTLQHLDAWRLRKRAYSPTSLQHYAACPYRFYLHGILRLRPREETEVLEQLDPLTRGSLYHAIQFAFLRGLAEADALVFDAELEGALLTRLDQAIDTVAEDYAERLRPALPAVYRGEVEDLRTDLRGWLRQVIADGNHTPSHFELSFGLPLDEEHDPASSRDPALILDRLLAKGSIDMVERTADGAYRVTDHKTGKARDTRNLTVGGGEALQPLVYAYAAAELLDAEVGLGRLWYSTRRGRYQSLRVPTGDYQRQALETVLQTIDESTENGFFPAAPRDSACRYCDYRAVCGPHEELRLQIKMRNPETRKRLEDLHHVRGME